MSLAALLNQPVIVQRRSATSTDEYGNEVDALTTSAAIGGYAEQTAAQELVVDRETYTTDWLVILPPGTAIDGSDRVVVGGHTLEVVGQPHVAWNPRASQYQQVECRCREVSGSDSVVILGGYGSYSGGY